VGVERTTPPRADGSRSSCGLNDRRSAQATAAQVTYDRTVARFSFAPTRQVTVTRIVCGVDIAFSPLAARVGQDGAGATFANTPEGIAELAAFCQIHQVTLVAMEATGGYEQRAFAQLSEHGLPVAVVNPRAVRQFAQSMGWLEKTDAIDAGMIAWYAAVVEVVGKRKTATSFSAFPSSRP